MASISCKQFSDYLIRRAEHFDSDIIKDITPTQGWIGHVSTGPFPAGEGVTRQFDKFHRVQPDMSAAWSDVTSTGCVGTPCDKTETEIGFGYTQEEYSLQEKSYKTQMFCFDLIMSADRAKEQFGHLIEILRDSSSTIISDRMKTEAFRIAGNKVLTGLTGIGVNIPFTYTSTGNLITVTPNALPDSVLTIDILQRWVQPLIFEGYTGAAGLPNSMFELVTDFETAWNLREGNSSLTNSFQFTDFAQGGQLYKYGITDAIGNFGIRIDAAPMRFLETGGVLHRVFPYKNQAASGGYGGAGIQGVVNQDYIDAPYQIDFIHHRMAMKSMTRSTEVINSMMPFAQRDFGGKWQFVMDNLGADANGCVIENKRRNKGMFIADYSMATKPERPEWEVAILSKRQRSCAAVTSVCTEFTPATYTAQDYSSSNEACENTVVITKGAGAYPITIDASSITCNGYNVAHAASASLANQAAVLSFLNTELSELGSWVASGASNVALEGAVCTAVTIPAFEA